MRDAEEGEAASSEAGRSIYCEQMDEEECKGLLGR